MRKRFAAVVLAALVAAVLGVLGAHRGERAGPRRSLEPGVRQAGTPLAVQATAGPDERLLRLEHRGKKNVTVWGTAGAAAAASGDPTTDATGLGTPGSWLDLNPEELAVLRAHSLEDLGQLTAQAEYAMLRAAPDERPGLERYYRMLLNLGAKVLQDDAPEPGPEMVERQRRYAEQARSLARRLRDLPAAERERRIAAFKDEFFRDMTAREQKKGSEP